MSWSTWRPTRTLGEPSAAREIADHTHSPVAMSPSPRTRRRPPPRCAPATRRGTSGSCRRRRPAPAARRPSPGLVARRISLGQVEALSVIASRSGDAEDRCSPTRTNVTPDGLVPVGPSIEDPGIVRASA
jgi:hypothetical protein